MMFVDYGGLEPVLLRYAVEKNGGYVSYYANDGSGNGPRVDITVQGLTVSYYGLTNINDRLIIDSGALSVALNGMISDEDLRHQAGDEFDSEKDAVLAFALKYHDISLSEQQEYGASIDKLSNGKFTFTNVVSSSSTWGISAEELNDTQRNSVNLSFDDNTVGVVHTHWREGGNLLFSYPQDYKIVDQGRYRAYLVTRLGEVFVCWPKGTNDHEYPTQIFSIP